VDRRVVELELTRDGRKVIDELLPLVVAEMNFALQPLERKEFDQFRGQLLRVLEHLQQAAPVVVAPPAAVRKAPRRRTPAGTRR
jgi:hypothetical protein